MGFMVICISLLTFLLVIIICKNVVIANKVKNNHIKSLHGGRQFIDSELEKSFFQRFFTPFWKKINKVVLKAAEKSKFKSKSSKNKAITNKTLATSLHLAGINMPVHEYQLIKLIVTILIIFSGLVSAFLIKENAQLQLLLLAFIIMFGIALPKLHLTSKIKKRQASIQNDLPNIMDVLSVSIEAGLGFDAALLKVIDRFKGPLIDEFSQVHREINMGRSRRAALNALSDRCPIDELKVFTTAVIQSEQYGTPLKNVLLSQSKQLRVNRRQMAQEKGAKAPIKMVLPMVGFIFPVIFIVLLGPTIINMIKQFS